MARCVAGFLAAVPCLVWSCSAGELARGSATLEEAQHRAETPRLAVSAAPPRAADDPAPLLERALHAAPAVKGGDEPAPTPEEPGGPARAPDERPELFAAAREVVIRERPSHRASKVGFLRLGARVVRAAEPEGHDGCRGGWYRIMPEGYVCVGAAATLDPAHEVLAFARTPDRARALPYSYGRAKAPPPRYRSLPEPAQAARPAPPAWADVESSELPALLASGGALPRPHGYSGAEERETTPPNSGFALLSVFDYGGRRFGLSTEYELLPLERLERVRPSGFHGVTLGEAGLPLVFVKQRRAYLYTGDPRRGLGIARQLSFREAVPITGEAVRARGIRYLKTRGGDWLRDEHLVRVDGFRERPTWAKEARSWIHVSILQQSLVAYEGDKPVYATLVSTGAGGLGDPAETHSTVRGTFLVHTKHVSTTMQGEEEDDAFLLSEVPYVQYFTEGYALHAAYWHDGFGTPRSHGCVNLSPIDARWLFHWSEPAVPRSWHSALSLRGGTLVRITP